MRAKAKSRPETTATTKAKAKVQTKPKKKAIHLGTSTTAFISKCDFFVEWNPDTNGLDIVQGNLINVFGISKKE